LSRRWTRIGTFFARAPRVPRNQRLLTNNARRAPARRAPGFTLFEVTVTLLIISALLGVSILSLDAFGGADLKSSARRMAGTVRSLRDEAALRAATVRLVIDLDEATYKAEYTEDPFGLYPAKLVIDDGAAVESDDEQREREDLEEFEEEQRSLSGSDSPATMQNNALTNAFGSAFFDAFDLSRVDRLKPAEFRPLEGRLSESTELPGDVVFDSYWAMHQEDVAENGLVYLYFFPTGMTERAVLYLDDGEGEIISLLVQPLTGEVAFEEGRAELPEEEEEEE